MLYINERFVKLKQYYFEMCEHSRMEGLLFVKGVKGTFKISV